MNFANLKSNIYNFIIRWFLSTNHKCEVLIFWSQRVNILHDVAVNVKPYKTKKKYDIKVKQNYLVKPLISIKKQTFTKTFFFKKIKNSTKLFFALSNNLSYERKEQLQSKKCTKFNKNNTVVLVGLKDTYFCGGILRYNQKSEGLKHLGVRLVFLKHAYILYKKHSTTSFTYNKMKYFQNFLNLWKIQNYEHKYSKLINIIGNPFTLIIAYESIVRALIKQPWIILYDMLKQYCHLKKIVLLKELLNKAQRQDKQFYLIFIEIKTILFSNKFLIKWLIRYCKNEKKTLNETHRFSNYLLNSKYLPRKNLKHGLHWQLLHASIHTLTKNSSKSEVPIVSNKNRIFSIILYAHQTPQSKHWIQSAKLWKIIKKRISNTNNKNQQIYTLQRIAWAFWNLDKIFSFVQVCKTKQIEVPISKLLEDPCILLIIYLQIKKKPSDNINSFFIENMTLTNITKVAEDIRLGSARFDPIILKIVLGKLLIK